MLLMMSWERLLSFKPTLICFWWLLSNRNEKNTAFKNLFESVTQGLRMTHIHLKQTKFILPLRSGWDLNVMEQWLYTSQPCAPGFMWWWRGLWPPCFLKAQPEEGTLWRMSRGRASLCTILLSYLSDLWALVALIKSDVYWVWNVLIC